jgi:dipeptidyl-peptidase-4
MSLTLQRIFGDPDLNGTAPVQLKLSPDSQKVSYLKASEDNFEQLNLWIFDIRSEQHTLLVDATDLVSQRILSDAEKARRERLRITQTGIVEYYWSPDGDALLFPIEGNLFLYRLTAEQPLTQLTDNTTFETDLRFSPDGQWIAFVRDQNLYCMNLTTLDAVALTTEGGGLISCGLAEFIAQEEMHRYNGYWWSPDSKKIAFTRTDESPVEVSQRYEIDADHFGVFDQRYPFAGKPNADVTIGVVNIETQTIEWINTESESGTNESYLARVNWFRDSIHLAVQKQSRDQQTLELLRCHSYDHSVQTLLTETSDSWINLNDNFTALEGELFIWGSERSGFNHLYLYNVDGTLVEQLTDGHWMVSDVKSLSAKSVLFTGYRDTPLEHHLYSLDRDTKKVTRISQAGYSHLVSVSADSRVFVDRFSSALTPPAVNLCKIGGEVIEPLEENKLDQHHPFTPYVSTRGDVTFHEIEADDGQTLHYRVIRPSSHKLEVNGQAPLILTVYGGPGVQRVTNDWIPPWHHYMAAQGYGLLQLDNRGTANRGKAFESPIYGEMGNIEVQDQLAGIDAVSLEDWVDKAGVSVAPVTDWHLYDTHYTERYLRHPDENVTGYEKSAVFPYAKDLNGNLLIIHGMADDNVLFSNSTKLYKTLQDLNIDFEIMNYPGAKHGLSGRNVNIHRYSMMDRFFAQHLT